VEQLLEKSEPLGPPSPPFDAIIFVPGLGEEGIDQSADGICMRIVDAMRSNANVRGTRYSIGANGRDEDFAPETRSSVRTISTKTGDSETPIFDVYKFAYDANLTKEHESRGVLAKSLILLATLIIYIPRVVASFSPIKKGKSIGEKFQLLYSISILSLLGIYTALLIATSLSMIVRFVQLQRGDQAGVDPWWLEVPAIATVALTFVGLTWSQLTQRLSRAGSLYLSAVHYLDAGVRRGAMIGQLEKLIEHVEDSEKCYGKIHIVAYSFGTVIALDTLFPVHVDELSRSRPRIATLVTIGSPFDLIRTYWPSYFARNRGAVVRPRWINIYSPLDLLSSNFRNDKLGGNPNRGVVVVWTESDSDETPTYGGLEQIAVVVGTESDSDETPTYGSLEQIAPDENVPYTDGPYEGGNRVFGFLALRGLRAHSIYWGEVYEGEKTCFPIVLNRLCNPI